MIHADRAGKRALPDGRNEVGETEAGMKFELAVTQVSVNCGKKLRGSQLLQEGAAQEIRRYRYRGR